MNINELTERIIYLCKDLSHVRQMREINTNPIKYRKELEKQLKAIKELRSKIVWIN